MDENCHPCEQPVVDRSPACPLHCGLEVCKAYAKKTPPDLSDKPIIWLIGGPGSGRRDHAKKISDKYGLTTLSVGDLLREEISTGCVRARCLVSAMNRYELVPNDVVIDLLKKAIEKHAIAGAKGFIIEGFPRHHGQGFLFERSIAPPRTILYYEVTADTLSKRLQSKTFASTRCRTDEDSIKARLKQFFENNRKIIEEYPHKLIRLDAEKAVDAVFKDVEKKLDLILKNNAVGVIFKEDSNNPQKGE